jgi:hypothetical protein
MSKQYNLNKKYSITLKIDFKIRSITDHFPNLEGLIIDLLKDDFMVQEAVEEIIENIEGEHLIESTSFDLVTIDVSNSKILNIETND